MFVAAAEKSIEQLTGKRAPNIFNKDVVSPRVLALPLRSMVGQLPLEQHIGVRIPEGQPNLEFKAV